MQTAAPARSRNWLSLYASTSFTHTDIPVLRKGLVVSLLARSEYEDRRDAHTLLGFLLALLACRVAKHVRPAVFGNTFGFLKLACVGLKTFRSAVACRLKSSPRKEKE